MSVFESFTQPAVRALFWARHEAGRSGSERIEPEHLLLGLLAEDQGDQLRAMASYIGDQKIGILERENGPFFTFGSAENLRHALARPTATGTPKADQVDMPVSERLQRTIRSAAEHAGDSKVTLLHILLALVSDSADPVSGLLKSNGVTPEQVIEAMRKRS